MSLRRSRGAALAIVAGLGAASCGGGDEPTAPPVVAGIRPAAFTARRRTGWAELAVVPELVEELGDERHVLFPVDAPPAEAEATRAAAATPGADALVPADQARCTAQVPADVAATRGRRMTLAFDPGRLHLVDPDTGAALHPRPHGGPSSGSPPGMR